jgi:O-antigen/teichoic acid export membrane protein
MIHIYTPTGSIVHAYFYVNMVVFGYYYRCYSEKREEAIKSYVYTFLFLTLFLGFPIVVGIYIYDLFKGNKK